ncbi:MAG: hypothetical protein EOQ30_22375 [Mesorhizobium sp.]|nr:MAG: hypothetical protein EOQ30_22375 [Mesorhizobium sp.]
MTSLRIRKLALVAAGISILSSCVVPDDTSRVAKEDVTAAAARKEMVGLSEADIRMCEATRERPYFISVGSPRRMVLRPHTPVSFAGMARKTSVLKRVAIFQIRSVRFRFLIYACLCPETGPTFGRHALKASVEHADRKHDLTLICAAENQSDHWPPQIVPDPDVLPALTWRRRRGR